MKKLLSIILTILMLASSMGVSLATHYCEGHAVASRLGLGMSLLDCGMNDMDDACSMPMASMVDKTHVKSGHCCENQYQLIDADDTILDTWEVKAVSPVFLTAFVYTYLGLQPFQYDFFTPYTSYSPPCPKQNRSVLYQAFLL